MSSEYDFVAIGDIVTDAFIKLSDAHVHQFAKETERELCIRYGDKVPYDSVTLVPAVGNSANASVAAAKLGLKSSLYVNVGDDDFGREDLEALKKANVSTEFIGIQKGKVSNYHFVLWFNADRTILVRHEAFDYKFPDVGEPKWIYLSSLGEAAMPMHDQITEHLEKHQKTRLAFQPGTFQMKAGYDRMRKIYERSDICIMNKEEAEKVLETGSTNINRLLMMMHDRGPHVVIITDGPNGAYAFDGEDAVFMPPYPDIAPPYERTGAGDAFASTLVSALALGESLEKALMWAPINSMSVVQKIGAQAGLLDRKQIEEYVKKAPKDYAPRKL